MAVQLLCVALLLIGLYCVAVKKNLIKIIVGLVIMEYSMSLLFVVLGYRSGGTDPIIDPMVSNPVYVDPIPQVFVLLLIAIGLVTTVTLTSIAMRLYQRYGTFDITEMRTLKG